jgi:predicted transcriptional regulator YdeE
MIIGISSPLLDESLGNIIGLWRQFQSELSRTPYKNSNNIYYGICGGNNFEGYTYMPAYKINSAGKIPPSMTVKQIKRNHYLYCRLNIHPSQIQPAWDYIFTNLLGSLNFELADSECIEIFHKMSKNNLHVNLCVPIIK